MKIEIVGFKCYSTFTTEISDGSVNLLKGPSGIGKSTILQAITWVLYGTLRGVSPSSGKKGKLSVRLTTPYIVIYRQKNPGLLQVTKGNQMFEDAVGQAIINEMFCGADLWSSVAYVSQGSRNALLSSSNNEKMELLNQVAFHGQNVEAYILKVDSAATQAKIEFETLQPQLTRDVDLFNKQFGNAKVDVNHAMSSVDIFALEVEIQTKQLLLHQLRTQLGLQQQKIGQLSLLKSQLITAQQVYEHQSVVDMTDHTSEIIRLEKMLAIEEKRQEYQKELAKITTSTIPLPEYNESELLKMREANANYNKHSLKCKDWGIEYKADVIADKIQHFKDMLAKQTHLPLAKQVRQLEEQLSKMPENDVTQEKVQAAETHLASLERGLNVLTCPHCDGSVRYISSKLVKESEKPASSEEVMLARLQVTQLKSQLQQSNQRLSLVKQIESLKANLPPNLVYEEPMIASSRKLVEEHIIELSKIVIYPETPLCFMNIEHALNTLANNKKSSRLMDEMRALPPSELTVSEITTKINDLRRMQAKAISAKALLDSSKTQIDKLQQAINQIVIDNGLEDRLKATETSITQMTERIALGRMVNLYLEQSKALTERSDELRKKHARLTHLFTLKAKMIEVECQVLQSTVDNINSILGEIVNGLFDEPITIALRLFKQNKTTERVRPVVNISINYKGAEFDNVNQLSGGEGDRISLALTLALNRVSGCPLVLLDESMSSLDGGVKEMCIHQIQNNTPGRTVICVNHEGVEGHYDHVIGLG